MNNSLDRLIFCLIGISIFCLVFFIYSGSLEYEFVSDDRVNVVNNLHIRTISLDNIIWAFSNAVGGHYQPFTWLSYMLDYSFWGLDTYGYRLNNIVLHCANTLLFMIAVYMILARFYSIAAGNKKLLLASSIGALFFSLHPLRVESVVWITERRDVLSTFFLLISFISYLYFKFNTGNADSSLKKNAYFISFIFFVFSLFSKAWAITFPFVLLIIDIALDENTKINVKTIVLKVKDKIPFFLCSVFFIFIGIISAGSSGAMISWEKLTFIDRLLQATYGFNTYLVHSVYPLELSPLYLLGKTNFLSVKYFAHFAFVVTVFVLAFLFRKQFPWPLYLFLIYLAIIFPVLGFAQSGPQMLADRYTYIALMPFSFAISWFLLKGLIEFFKQKSKRTLYLSSALIIVLLTTFSVLITLTLEQIKVWKNEGALWSHALHIDETNYRAINNRADYKVRNGMYREAIKDYTLALSLNKSDVYALNGRAASSIYLGEFDNALEDLNKSLSILPAYVDAVLNRGVVYNNQGLLQLAQDDFEMVVKLEPQNIKGNFYLAISYFSQKEFKKAIELFTHVYYLNSTYIDAIYYRGLANAGVNNIHQAIKDFEYIIDNTSQESPIYKNAEDQIRLLRNG